MNRLDLISMEIKSMKESEQDEKDFRHLQNAIISVDSATERLSYVWDQELALRNINKAQAATE